jgi:hypothetical protein
VGRKEVSKSAFLAFKLDKKEINIFLIKTAGASPQRNISLDRIIYPG